MSYRLTEIDQTILNVLRESKAPLCTADLAQKVGIDPKKAYRRCRRLKNKIGALKQEKGPSPRQLMFSPIFGEVVTRHNVKRIRKTYRVLDRVVWKTAKKHKRLSETEKLRIREDIERKLQELGTSPERRAILKQRLAKALSDCGGTHASGAFSSVPFSPLTSYWSPAGDSPVPYPLPMGATKKDS